MTGMSKSHRWKRRATSPGEEAAAQAPAQEPVAVDIARLQASLESPRFVMPSGLTPEEKRQFMIAVAHGHR